MSRFATSIWSDPMASLHAIEIRINGGELESFCLPAELHDALVHWIELRGTPSQWGAELIEANERLAAALNADSEQWRKK